MTADDLTEDQRSPVFTYTTFLACFLEALCMQATCTRVNILQVISHQVLYAPDNQQTTVGQLHFPPNWKTRDCLSRLVSTVPEIHLPIMRMRQPASEQWRVITHQAGANWQASRPKQSCLPGPGDKTTAERIPRVLKLIACLGDTQQP